MPKVQPIPSASSGRGRRARGSRVSTSLAEINVVPLVDVMLVLLIIFMVAAPMMTEGMQVNLPQARKATQLQAEPVYVTIPASFGKDHRVQIGNDTIAIEALSERVKQALMTREDKSIFIRSDSSVTVQQLIAVTDKLNAAGVQKIGFLTQPLKK